MSLFEEEIYEYNEVFEEHLQEENDLFYDNMNITFEEVGEFSLDSDFNNEVIKFIEELRKTII